MRHQGKITTWKDEQGFGFITPNGGGEPVFVHIKTFANRQRRPLVDEIVTYELASDGQGRAQARHVDYPGGRRGKPAASSGPSRLPLIVAALFLALVGIGVLTARLPLLVLGWYVGTSLVTFIAYSLDKAAAQADRRRTPEDRLHLLALIGGWPGALVAQNRLRHKSRKLSFLVVFWATVLLNCGALSWALTANGGRALRSALNGLV
jgi:uncharacterized membrane protein YsdA (DUF1294 family)/cold shock CspA family protein